MRPPARCSRRPEVSQPRETGDPHVLCGAEGGVSGGRAPAAPSTTAIQPPRSGPITERRGRGRQEASPLPQPLASAARGRPVPGDAAEGLRGGGQRSPKKGKVRGAALRPRAPAPGDLPAAPARSGRSRRLLAARCSPPAATATRRPVPGLPGHGAAHQAARSGTGERSRGTPAERKEPGKEQKVLRPPPAAARRPLPPRPPPTILPPAL